MAVFVLDDEGGKVEVVVFPEAYNRYGGLIADDALLLVRGKYERDEMMPSSTILLALSKANRRSS